MRKWKSRPFQQYQENILSLLPVDGEHDFNLRASLEPNSKVSAFIRLYVIVSSGVELDDLLYINLGEIGS